MAAVALDETGQALTQNQNGQGDSPADEQRQPRERRSRDRYGRDRRERGEERGESGERSEQTAESAAAPAGSEQNQAPAMEERAPVATEFIASAVAPAAAPAPAPAYTAPVAVAAAPVATPVPVPAPATASIMLPKVQAYALHLQDLAQVAESSGLQWVNSDAAKIAEAQAAIAAEMKPAHVPRERPPLAVSDEGPLVLVETKRNLGSMTLPFEQPPA